jgi:hypothetical protein
VNDDMNIKDMDLPALSDERVDELEAALFASIARDRDEERTDRERRRRVTRGRLWMGGTASAAVIAVAAVLAPSMPGLIGGVGEGSTAISPEYGGRDLGGGVDPGDTGSTSGEESAPPDAGPGDTAVPERDIIAQASATLRVDDVEAAASSISDTAGRLGGYVEAMSVGGDKATTFSAPAEDVPTDGAVTEPAPMGAWVTVRVPAASLDEATAALRELGEVTATQIDRRDVTAETVDLRARVEALQASVDRLTALVADAESTSDLIAAEEVLSARQADLEAYQQQLKYLDDQVGMSSLTVSLTTEAPAVKADPAGFGDGVAAGWNGLVATLNGLVLALGFLLPWLAVVAVALLVFWLVRRVRRTRRTSADAGGPKLGAD